MFAADQTELEAKKADADAVIVESLIIDRPMHAAVQRPCAGAEIWHHHD